MSFFTKQKDGDAPLALQDQRGQEGIPLEYMRDGRLGQTTEKKGEFRETSREDNGERFLVSGYVDAGGVQTFGGWVGREEKQKFKASKNLFFKAAVVFNTIKLMSYLGRNVYGYLEQTQTTVLYQTPGVFPGCRIVNLPVLQCQNFIGMQNGKSSTSKNPIYINEIYCSSFDDVYGHLFSTVGDAVQPSIKISPLDTAGEDGVTSLVSWPTLVNQTPNAFGMLKSGWVYATMTSKGLSDVVRVIPQQEYAWPGFGWGRWRIFVVTPLIWCAIGGVYQDAQYNFDAANLGGLILYYRTIDGGASWNTIQDNGTIGNDLTAFNIGLPNMVPIRTVNLWRVTPPNQAPEDTVNMRNLSVRNALFTMEFCAVSPKIWLASYHFWGPPTGAEAPILDYGHLYNHLNYAIDYNIIPPQTMVAKSRVLRTIDGGASWSVVAMPALLETQIVWPNLSTQAYLFRDITYLGAGVLLAKIRGGFADFTDDAEFPLDPFGILVWNLARSTDYGATFTCIPKVGLPASADARYIGKFTVVKKCTRSTGDSSLFPATVIQTGWDGDGYYAYISKDNGDSWLRGGKLAASEHGQPMDLVEYSYFGPPFGIPTGAQSFRFLEYTGDASSPVDPINVATPWRFNSKRKWVAE